MLINVVIKENIGAYGHCTWGVFGAKSNSPTGLFDDRRFPERASAVSAVRQWIVDSRFRCQVKITAIDDRHYRSEIGISVDTPSPSVLNGLSEEQWQYEMIVKAAQLLRRDRTDGICSEELADTWKKIRFVFETRSLSNVRTIDFIDRFVATRLMQGIAL